MIATKGESLYELPMDSKWQFFKRKAEEGIYNAIGSMQEHNAKVQDQVNADIDRGYRIAQSLSYEELERKVRENYNEKNMRDGITIGMGKNLVERKNQKNFKEG